MKGGYKTGFKCVCMGVCVWVCVGVCLCIGVSVLFWDDGCYNLNVMVQV